VAHYGGKIWAESVLGKGSVITFNLPIEQRILLENPEQSDNSDSSISAST
jgi:signal transduction histidine kinase